MHREYRGRYLGKTHTHTGFDHPFFNLPLIYCSTISIDTRNNSSHGEAKDNLYLMT